MAQTLTKQERLSGKTAVGDLMKKGHWGVSGCLKYCWLPQKDSSLHRIMVSVPKRNFKRAVKRNLLKRHLRESYRTQKELLGSGNGVDLLLFYNSRELFDRNIIASDVAQVLKTVENKLI